MVLSIIVVPITFNDVEAQQAGDQYRARAARTDVAPALDGILEQGVWEPAGLINELIQQEPIHHLLHIHHQRHHQVLTILQMNSAFH